MQDTRPVKLGDALLASRLLDYDLVRQITDEMNKVKVFRGYHTGSNVPDGSTAAAQHTHVLSSTESETIGEALKCLRADIRYFKWRNGVVGHTTVLYAAPEAEQHQSDDATSTDFSFVQDYKTARELLEGLDRLKSRGAVAPSVLYGTAALLEGCSFVAATDCLALDCPGLYDLARQQVGVYCFGNDLRPLYAVGGYEDDDEDDEYDSLLSKWGVQRTVVHNSRGVTEVQYRGLLGVERSTITYTRQSHNTDNNDTSILGDTSDDLLSSGDSLWCTPMLIDAAVLCDYFSSTSWPLDKVSNALSYMFVGGAAGSTRVDPLSALRDQIQTAGSVKTNQHQRNTIHNSHQSGTNDDIDSASNPSDFGTPAPVTPSKTSAASNTNRPSNANPIDTMTSPSTSAKKRVRIRPEEKTSEWAIPHNANVICAGLACVDMQLNHATGGDGGEAIETFQGETSIGGGSVSMACKTLARLCHGAPLDDHYMQVAPPVVQSVVPLCKIGNDDTGRKLLQLLEKCGEASRNIETKHAKAARRRDANARTALAVLPIYQDGRRGCFFDAASNATFSPDELMEMIHGLTMGANGPALNMSGLSLDEYEDYQERIFDATPAYGAFLFGYPHLLPMLQGEDLVKVLIEARNTMIEGGIIALDLNGVPEVKFERNGFLRNVVDLQNDKVIGPALPHVDILHMNEDELVLLTGCEIENKPETQLEDEFAIASAVNLFLLCGVGIVVVTRGKKGSFVSCNDEARFARSKMLPPSWVDCTAKLGVAELPPGTVLNTNGAGDSFTAGFLVATMLRHTGMTVPVQKDGDGDDDDNNNGVDTVDGDGTGTTKKNGMNNSKKSVDRQNDSSRFNLDSSEHRPKPSSPTQKLTPYQLYMRENYVMLKQQCNDDKRAIFTKCHQMWENESAEVKAMYERKAQEESEEQQQKAASLSGTLVDDLEILDDSTPKHQRPSASWDAEEAQKNLYMTNRALNLESAIQFASLVAAHHVDVSTRDLIHIDVSRLLERSLIFPEGLEEI